MTSFDNEMQGHIGQQTFRGVSLRYVALCEVLGFRAILAEKGVEWLGEQYRALAKDVATASRFEARSHVFGNSLLIYTPPIPILRTPNHELTLGVFVDGYLAWVASVVRSGMEHDLPLRGGVGAGPCVISAAQQVFVGQPIVDAYILEQQQDWVGIAIHESCFTWCGRRPTDNYFRQVVRYPIPPNPRLPPPNDLEWSLAWPVMLHEVVSGIQSRVKLTAEMHVGSAFERRWRNTYDYVAYLASLERFRRVADREDRPSHGVNDQS